MINDLLDKVGIMKQQIHRIKDPPNAITSYRFAGTEKRVIREHTESRVPRPSPSGARSPPHRRPTAHEPPAGRLGARGGREAASAACQARPPGKAGPGVPAVPPEESLTLPIPAAAGARRHPSPPRAGRGGEEGPEPSLLTCRRRPSRRAEGERGGTRCPQPAQPPPLLACVRAYACTSPVRPGLSAPVSASARPSHLPGQRESPREPPQPPHPPAQEPGAGLQFKQRTGTTFWPRAEAHAPRSCTRRF